MKLGRLLRIALGAGLFIAFGLALLLVFSVTDQALNLWSRLEAVPAALRWLLVGLFVLLILTFFVLVWRLLRPASKRTGAAPVPTTLDEAGLRQRLESVQAEGVDASAAEREMALLQSQRDGAGLSIALYGEVSTGKSSLAAALLPGAEVSISPLAGSTTEVSRYHWVASTGAEIVIADLPGLEAVGRELDQAMLDEARRAHAVVFVTDGDLNRQQVEALQALAKINKPLIVTLNKADRYTPEEQSQLLARLQARLTGNDQAPAAAPQALVVTIAGGETSVVAEDDAGQEVHETRAREADISQLVLALEELLGGDLAAINALREHALLTLAAEQLARAESAYRQQRAEQIIRKSTGRAVVGALAAVTPGTDIVIQGYIGTTMTRELCALYGQTAKQLEIERFLDLSQSRVGKAAPLALAIAGNGLKAFPGVGTIAGGAVHAVAYGLIFDAVGRGLAASLEAEGAFSAQAAVAQVEEGMDDYLAQGVRRIARLALEHSVKPDRD